MQNNPTSPTPIQARRPSLPSQPGSAPIASPNRRSESPDAVAHRAPSRCLPLWLTRSFEACLLWHRVRMGMEMAKACSGRPHRMHSFHRAPAHRDCLSSVPCHFGRDLHRRRRHLRRVSCTGQPTVQYAECGSTRARKPAGQIKPHRRREYAHNHSSYMPTYSSYQDSTQSSLHHPLTPSPRIPCRCPPCPCPPPSTHPSPRPPAYPRLAQHAYHGPCTPDRGRSG